MTTQFSYGIGQGAQGRVIPELRNVVETDSPTAAYATTLAAEPYALVDGDDILVAFDEGATQSVVFSDASFLDIGVATAQEVADAINASSAVGGTAAADNGVVVWSSTTTGAQSRISIKGGSAQSELALAVTAQGTQGKYSMVLGDERPGQFFTVSDGDGVSISQTGTVTTNALARVRGHVTWRGSFLDFGWELALTGSGFGISILDRNAITSGWPVDASLNDMAVPVSSGGPQTVTVGVDRSPYLGFFGADGPVPMELPAVYVDHIDIDESPGPLALANRWPYPGHVGVPAAMTQIFGTLLSQTTPVDPTSVDMHVDGVPAVLGGVTQAPFGGPGVIFTGQHAIVVVAVSGAQFLNAPSEFEVVVQVTAETTGGDELYEVYSFFLADTDPPRVLEVTSTSLTTALVRYSEPVKMTTDSDGALNPANYSIEQRSAPSVDLTVVSVTQNDDSSVVVTYDSENSMGATYRLAAANVADLQDNVIDQPGVDYQAFRRQQPAGRFADLWSTLPDLNKQVDTEGTLRKLVLCIQEVFDVLLDMSDVWPQVWQVDKAPENFLDVILAEMGNPFTALATTYAEKRRLVGVLTTIYRQKGTAEGIINTIRFFCDIDVEIDVFNKRDNFWELGFDELGKETFVAPGRGDPAWYSFWIVSPAILTDAERTKVLAIADYMKPAHEHILGIQEPGQTSATADYWSLGSGVLGVSSIVGA